MKGGADAVTFNHKFTMCPCMCSAVCRPGVEPLAGFTKQNVRKCRPGFAKRGNGNFK